MLEPFQEYFGAGGGTVEDRLENLCPWSKMTKSCSFLQACADYPAGWLEQHLPAHSYLKRKMNAEAGPKAMEVREDATRIEEASSK